MLPPEGDVRHVDAGTAAARREAREAAGGNARPAAATRRESRSLGKKGRGLDK